MTYISLLILIAGLLMFLLCNGKASEIGRMMFFAALLALCITVFAPLSAHLFHG